MSWPELVSVARHKEPRVIQLSTPSLPSLYSELVDKSPKVCLLNKRGEGMAGLSEEDELEFALVPVMCEVPSGGGF